MTLYEKFKKMNISHSAIGLGQSDDNSPYYCTPKDAEIIGWAGVDGIHYCTIPEFGEMIFAVSPMNFGDCVHPIARNFGDLLSLLLSCADMGVLEQCYAWDRDQYDAFLLDCPATDEQKSVLDEIRRELAIEPITDAFSYVKELQSEFDLSEIPYTVDYYDPDMNPAAPASPTEFAEWKVYYDGGFYCADGNDDDLCVEIPVEKSFCWDEEKWYVPSVYICGKGLVIDYCVEVDPDRIQAHADKWNLHSEELVSYTEEQQAELIRENPLRVDFHGYVTLNGQKLRNRCREYVYWQTGGNSVYDRCNPEAEFAVRHYGLDDKRVWVICRCCYEGDVSEGDIRSLSVHIEREREEVAALCFQTPAVGENVAVVNVTNPISGKTFTLTVHSVEQQSLFENAFHDPDMEFPRHFVAMSYSLEPDIPALHFLVQDCAKSDTPVHKNRANNSTAVSFAVIGGADGPVAVGMANSASATTEQNTPNVHTACSSLHFSPVSEVEWKFVFLEKFKGDIDVILI